MKNFFLSTILFALTFLVFFAISITWRALPAFHQHYITLKIFIDPEEIIPDGNLSPEALAKADYGPLIKKALRNHFPDITSRSSKRRLYKIVSINSPYILADHIIDHPELVGEMIDFSLPADDEIDLLLKYNFNIENAGGISRNIQPDQIEWLKQLKQQNRIENRFNFAFFTSGDSREPETAGIANAVLGSLWLLLITLILSVPLGVLTAIYLTEFAPKNYLTSFIEVNINNLAAVPSIVFGLLGLGIFLNFFGLPRSTPLVGGLILALMSMPTIIIVTRSALISVPKSIRVAVLAIGASRMQMVFHHILPICFPSILTGSIIAMAQALGETAPLLMIGMVAFILNTPSSPLDFSSALPVQIFIWADAPEYGFASRSAAAILVLLIFLTSVNLLSAILRHKFSQKL